MSDAMLSFLSAIFTRIGALVLLTYGTQILISLYKYSMRLSAFNDSLADAIELNREVVNEDLMNLFERMDPTKITFGKDVKPPASEFIDFVKDILKSKIDVK
jgi:hypothetical protein